MEIQDDKILWFDFCFTYRYLLQIINFLFKKSTHPRKKKNINIPIKSPRNPSTNRCRKKTYRGWMGCSAWPTSIKWRCGVVVIAPCLAIVALRKLRPTIFFYLTHPAVEVVFVFLRVFFSLFVCGKICLQGFHKKLYSARTTLFVA